MGLSSFFSFLDTLHADAPEESKEAEPQEVEEVAVEEEAVVEVEEEEPEDVCSFHRRWGVCH
jgi:hypothetical protein